MSKEKPLTFIVDCPWCKAKVAAIETGRAVSEGYFGEPDGPSEPFGKRVHIGKCPNCDSILAGESEQRAFVEMGADYDSWSDCVRVYPKPPRIFASTRIPKVVRDSLAEADRAIQANANTAACVMLGRALEAICRHLLQLNEPSASEGTGKTAKKKIMLGEGIKKLKEKGIIDKRLFDWSQQLQAFRNLAAHPDEDFTISREDSADLQTFVYAITEYTYDLADRYEEFLDRLAWRNKKRKASKSEG
ncbi:MAG TPA: DUF4145 domain-containing protein [Gemmataceae bacterium]|nr:DUF4145 domain-containing protein [Gemmataceae bacterium]